MSVLNQLYLSELSKQYKIESVEMFEFGFSSYCISPNSIFICFCAIIGVLLLMSILC